MRYAVCSDVHSNLESLTVMLAKLDEADGLLCLGDMVGYGPNPNECVELIRTRATATILGNHDVAAVDAYGDIDEPSLTKALARAPIVAALPWATNATGPPFPLARYARLAKDAGAIVVADGVQAAPHVRTDMPPDVDFAFFSAYKIFGPHVGFFYAPPEVAERFFRADVADLPSPAINWAMETGTQCYEGWAGWLGTLEYLRELGDGDLRRSLDIIAADERILVDYALDRFAERGAIRLLGGPADRSRLPVFAFNVAGYDPEDVARALAAENIEARIGDYYSRRLMRVLAADYGGRAVRFSFAHYNTTADVDRCFAVLDGKLDTGGRLGTVASGR